MALTKAKLIADGVIVAANLHASHGITSANIGENTNLYFTNARARSAISVSGNALSYNSSTGVITSNFEESPTFTGNVNIENATSPTIALKDTTNNVITKMFSANSQGFVGTESNHDLRIRTNNTDKVSITSGGNVGIGTTSPNEKLTISGNINITGTGGYLRWNSGDIAIVNAGSYAMAFQTYTGAALTEKMRITSAGNVGIGTTSPGAKLDIHTATNTNGILIKEDTDDSITHNFYIDSADNGVGILYANGQSAKIQLNTAGNSYFNGGNVGIGTTSIGARLEVAASATTSVDIAHFSNNNSVQKAIIGLSSVGSGQLVLRDAGNNEDVLISSHGDSYFNGGNIGIGTTSPARKFHVSKASNGNIALFTNVIDADLNINLTSGVTMLAPSTGIIALGTSSTERMRIDSSGNVGIGTASPSHALDVTSAAYDQVQWTRTSGVSGYLYSDSAGAGIYSGASFSQAGIYLVPNTSMDFRVNGSRRMYINSSGHVGIGTISPARELEVQGGGNVYIRVTAPTDNDSAALELKNTQEMWSIRNEDTNADALHFNSDGGTKMVIQTGGNVGIGTTSPDFELEVAGNIGIDDKIYHNGDHNTFIAFTGDTQTFRTGGSDRVTINNTGVGIGTTNPDSPLSVKGATGLGVGASGLRVHRPDSFGQFGFFDYGQSSSTTYIGSSYTGGNANNYGIIQFRQLSNGGAVKDTMTISSNNNVGIGTTSPDQKLVVNQTSTGKYVIKAEYNGTNLGGFFVDGSGNNELFLKAASNVEKVKIDTAGASHFSGGNVGIGTAGPNDKLEVSGGNIRISHNSPILRFKDTDVTNLEHRVLGGGNAGLEYSADVNNVAAGYHRWDISNSEKMRLVESGNLGIGTTLPAARLEVRGAVATGMATEDEEVSVTLNGGSAVSSGTIEMTQGWTGTMSSGDTVVFRYNAQAWKSWALEFMFVSTNGMSDGTIGGYNNNSSGRTTDIRNNNHGMSISYSRDNAGGGTGQTNIVTFTFTGLGIHPFCHFKYFQSGGDGRPVGSKASITLNS
tara:strand:- start:466 stop:3552 length:3087 start_codon:yes stop_codon:yes gene_type:complete